MKTLGRRNFLFSLAGSAAASLLLKKSAKAEILAALPSSEDTKGSQTAPVPVQTPGVSSLPSRVVGNVREFRLTAEPVTVMFPDMSDGMGMQGRPINVYGYNGSMTGPTIEAFEGETVRVIVTNKLSEPTTVHFHGIELPIEMDGVPGMSQTPIPPGGTFVYEFPLNQSGTYLYHSHYMAAKQVGLGMMGFFIVHPKNPTPSQIVDHDYAYFLHTWKINPGSSIPDVLEMNNFNTFLKSWWIFLRKHNLLIFSLSFSVLIN